MEERGRKSCEIHKELCDILISSSRTKFMQDSRNDVSKSKPSASLFSMAIARWKKRCSNSFYITTPYSTDKSPISHSFFRRSLQQCLWVKPAAINAVLIPISVLSSPEIHLICKRHFCVYTVLVFLTSSIKGGQNSKIK